MITLDDIRRFAAAMPEVEEQTHFGRPGFRVRGKLFATVHLDADSPNAIVHVNEDEAAAAAVDDPDACETVWRTHGQRQIFVGLRVDLAKVDGARVRELVDHAWRHNAPKRLVAAHEEDR